MRMTRRFPRGWLALTNNLSSENKRRDQGKSQKSADRRVTKASHHKLWLPLTSRDVPGPGNSARELDSSPAMPLCHEHSGGICILPFCSQSFAIMKPHGCREKGFVFYTCLVK